MSVEMIDLTAQLRSQIRNVYDDMDGPSDRVIAHEMPAPDPEFAMIHVSDDIPHSGCVGPWIVECDTGARHLDASEAAAYAAAMAAAARQALILNSDTRIVSIPDDGRFREGMEDGGPFAVARMVEAGYADQFTTVRDITSPKPLEVRTPGYSWRTDGYGFIYYGMFEWFGEDIVGGQRRVLLKEAPRG
ncbi:hypothetical protein SAMN06295974_0331 [Plantibacter flavus]|uniref:Uncharacterized protein n=1 Tax=Plantibacter flavus TaxID=150123 RepID=A0A3N2C0S6_9MICO|nr:hypothetical protein [Plantibacter flavus]ROR81107.1 hypothetical protein EDD42_1158 [Plantibacter flavus]SMG07945.1 hypothetical protein SAMN06295974_0331 [Plantibacter flavus]